MKAFVYILGILLSLPLSGNCQKAVEPTDYLIDRSKLKGQIKRISRAKYFPKEDFDLESAKHQTKTVEVFNEKGERVSGEYYDSYSISGKRITFNKKGHWTEIFCCVNTKTGEEKFMYKTESQEDERGNIIEWFTSTLSNNVNFDSTFTKVIFTYSVDGKLEKNEDFRGRERDKLELYNQEVFQYDSQGNIIEEYREIGGKIFYIKKFQYDDQGNKLLYEHLNESSYLGGSEYTYDERNNLIQDIQLNSKKTPKRIAREKFDQNNMGIEFSEFYGSGKLRRKVLREYDEHLNWTKISISDSNGKVNSEFAYEYEYDGKGNWIKKKGFLRKEGEEQWTLNTLEIQEIEYFEE